jgi:hypothetical protein
MMSDWQYAQTEPRQQLAQLAYFSIKNAQGIEFVITVKHYVSPPDPTMPYFAQADKQTNQNTMPFTPIGWGVSLLDALAECVRAIDRFPYQGPPTAS